MSNPICVVHTGSGFPPAELETSVFDEDQTAPSQWSFSHGADGVGY